MAKKSTIQQFRGTDHTFKFPILNVEEDTALSTTDWTFDFVVKQSPDDLDASALIHVANADITKTGTFDADPTVNTERVNVFIADTLTDNLAPGEYAWELKRTNDGFEAILGYGTYKLLQTQHRS